MDAVDGTAGINYRPVFSTYSGTRYVYIRTMNYYLPGSVSNSSLRTYGSRACVRELITRFWPGRKVLIEGTHASSGVLLLLLMHRR